MNAVKHGRREITDNVVSRHTDQQFMQNPGEYKYHYLRSSWRPTASD